MRRVLAIISVVSGVWLACAQPTLAQDAIGRAFADAFYGEVGISEIVRERPDVSMLEKAEMNELLKAKDALAAFFQALKPGAKDDVRAFLDPSLAGRFADKTALRRERFGAAAYLSLEIIDFRISEGLDEIKLRYFLSESDQGKALIRQRAVTFRHIGDRWLIAEFDNFQFD